MASYFFLCNGAAKDRSANSRKPAHLERTHGQDCGAWGGYYGSLLRSRRIDRAVEPQV